MARRHFRVAIAAVALAVAGPVVAQNPSRADLERYLAQVDIVRPGLGEDPGLPNGTPVTLPAGVKVSSPIFGVSSIEECEAAGQGSGDAVLACVPLCNANATPTRVRLPAGMMLISKSASAYQNGLLIEDVEVMVPPSSCGPGGLPVNKDPGELDREGPIPAPGGFRVALRLYCLNESMAPSETGVPYALGPVTSDPDLQGLLRAVSGKALNEDEVQSLQTAIWSITEGRGLTPADRTAVAAF